MKKKLVAILTGAAMVGMSLMPVAALAQEPDGICSGAPIMIMEGYQALPAGAVTLSADVIDDGSVPGPFTDPDCVFTSFAMSANGGIDTATGTTLANTVLTLTCSNGLQVDVETTGTNNAGLSASAVTTVAIDQDLGPCVAPTPTPPPVPVCDDNLLATWTQGPIGTTTDTAWDIAVDGVNGFVYSVGLINNYPNPLLGPVFKTDLDGNLLDTWYPTPNYGFTIGAAVDSAGNFWVATGTNDLVFKLDSNGNLLQTLGVETAPGSGVGVAGSADGQFNQPRDIAFDSVGNIYIADSLNFRVDVFDSSGTFLAKYSLGSPGPSSVPQFLAIDANDDVYVAAQGVGELRKYSNTFGSPLWTKSGVGAFGVGVNSNNEVYVSASGFISKFDSAGNALGTLPGFSGLHGVAFDASNNLYTHQDKFTVKKFGCEPSPELSQCTLDALAAMGIAPDTYPEMDEALEGVCEDTTIIEIGDANKNYKLSCPESIVVADGAEVGQNVIGSNKCENQLFLGNNGIVNGNVLKTEDVWVAGTGNSISGHINHEVSVHIGPGADLYVGKSINDLQTLEVGAAGYLHVSDDMDIWVDIINEGTVEVGRTFSCNGLSGVPTMSGDIFADNDNCPYVSAGPLASGNAPWLYATLAAVLGFGMALVISERGKKKA